jgi:hypothetical protein
MFAIVLLTIYHDEAPAPSAITILALFPEKKKPISDRIGIVGK